MTQNRVSELLNCVKCAAMGLFGSATSPCFGSQMPKVVFEIRGKKRLDV